MIALYVLGGILLLLLLPLTARFRFRGEGIFTVRYAGIPVFRFDSSKKSEPTKPKTKSGGKPLEKTKKKKEKKEKNAFLQDLTTRLKAEGVSAVLTYLTELGRLLGGTVRRLFRSLHFGKCRVDMNVGGSEAADVALKYGKLSGPVASIAVLLRENLRFRRLSVTLTPDFLHETDTVTADIRVCAIPLAVLWAAIRSLFAYIGMTIRLSKESEEV